MTGTDSGETHDLLAIATNGGDKRTDCIEYKVDDMLAVGITQGDGYGYSLTAGIKYTNVPEPTSAMLLLLGFAGLALKRKVA